jgi:hypothetical protein
VITLKQPMHVLLGQRWVFARSELTGFRLKALGAARPGPVTPARP